MSLMDQLRTWLTPSRSIEEIRRDYALRMAATMRRRSGEDQAEALRLQRELRAATERTKGSQHDHDL